MYRRTEPLLGKDSGPFINIPMGLEDARLKSQPQQDNKLLYNTGSQSLNRTIEVVLEMPSSTILP